MTSQNSKIAGKMPFDAQASRHRGTSGHRMASGWTSQIRKAQVFIAHSRKRVGCCSRQAQMERVWVAHAAGDWLQ
jgi:hypothetical protein